MNVSPAPDSGSFDLGAFVDTDRAGGRASLEAGIGEHVSVGAEAWAAYDRVLERGVYGAAAGLKVVW